MYEGGSLNTGALTSKCQGLEVVGTKEICIGFLLLL